MESAQSFFSLFIAALLSAGTWTASSRQTEAPPTRQQEVAGESAQALLARAAGALKDKRSARYKARYSARYGPIEIAARRSMQGVVHLALPPSDFEPSGVRLRIEGTLSDDAPDSPPLPFAMTSDGARVRLRVSVPLESEERIVWEAALPGAGEDLLAMGDVLRVEGLLTPAYLRIDGASGLSLLPREQVDGGACHVVRVQHGSVLEENLREDWLISVEDLLPREVRRSYRTRGVEVEEVLSLERMEFPEEYAAEFFALDVPEGWRLESYGDAHEHPDELVSVGAVAPSFHLRDPAGREHELSQYRGRIVVLDFWATWCQPCLATMPSLQALADRFRKDPVTVLGLSTWDDGAPDEYMRSKGYTYGLLLEADDTAAHYGVGGLPTIVVIDEEGRVLAVHVGHDPDLLARLGSLIEARLAAGRR